MTKICTDVEQSRKLLELGIDANTADMWWTALNWQETEYYVEVKQDGINQPKKAIPAWSLTALLKILHYPTLSQDFNHNWTCDSFGKEMETVCDWGPQENVVDAAYNMIIKLHEKNLL